MSRLSSSGGLTCETVDNTNNSITNLNDVCGLNNSNIKATVIIGNSIYSTDRIEIQNTQVIKNDTTGSIPAATANGNNITKGTTNAYVIFEYLGSIEPDFAVKVTIPTITNIYKTAE